MYGSTEPFSVFPSSKLIFTNPDEDDVGTFSVAVTHTNNVSSSYAISLEGGLTKRLLTAHDIRNQW